jgi:hypothetical protein
MPPALRQCLGEPDLSEDRSVLNIDHNLDRIQDCGAENVVTTADLGLF